MEDPIIEIHEVVHKLTTGTPQLQQDALERYFTPNASFKHPFCSVKGDRKTILRIFQWYKIMSPDISIQINSVAFDETKSILYVNISQTFSIWLVPLYEAPVTLTSVLELVYGPNLNNPTINPKDKRRKYYIASQNDLYQVDQFIRFILPWGMGIALVAVWHWWATLFCILGAKLLGPIQWLFMELSSHMAEDASPVVSPKTVSALEEDRRGLDETLAKDERDGEAYHVKDGMQYRVGAPYK